MKLIAVVLKDLLCISNPRPEVMRLLLDVGGAQQLQVYQARMSILLNNAGSFPDNTNNIIINDDSGAMTRIPLLYFNS